LSAPVILTGAWLSRWIIPLIDGGKYPGAISVFRILAVSAIISLAFSPYVNTVMRFGKFRYLLGLVCGGICISVGGNLVLVPFFGAAGTAVSTLISFAFVNGMTYLKGSELLRNSEHLPNEDILSDEGAQAPAAAPETAAVVD
jgi:O-antigen/teichoic acid export membrane protein